MWSAYADDSPGRPAEPDPAAVPGLRPGRHPGRDAIELVVDGETWVVSRRADTARSIEFDWVSHPHGYGFSSTADVDRQPSTDELIEQIRGFMAEVDPVTGHLPD